MATNNEPPTGPTPLFKPTEAEPTGSHSHHRLRVDPPTAVAVSVSAFLLLVLLLAMGFFFRFLRRLDKLKKRRNSSRPSDVQVDPEKKDLEFCHDEGFSETRKYSWEEIEKSTISFSRVIGSGGFSNVYLANLSGSTHGAVKIHVGGDRLSQVFKQELDILLRLRHENIVRLLGYCDDREEGAMVFEYIPNGNLQEKLRESEWVLPWRNRMAIAFQLAQAIEYLHEKCALQIVHGDIKASNILLDEHLNCKLCDFGSAKMGFSSTVLPPPSSSRIKQLMIGSPGYTDPHYLRTGIASKKNDVYSLGVICLELLTGMEAFCPEKGQRLTSILEPVLSGVAEAGNEKLAAIVDPRLNREVDLEEARAVLSIAALCLQQSPTLRPSATQILQKFQEKIPSISFLFIPDKNCHERTT